MSRIQKSFVFVLVAFFVATNIACNKELAGPSALPTAVKVSPTPAGQAAGSPVPAATPTPALDLPSTFSFVQVDNMAIPSEQLPIWGLRGNNSAEAVKMMSFCGTGVTSPAAENRGLRPMRKPMGPMTLVIGPGFTGSDLEIMRSSVETEFGLNVPLSLEMGENSTGTPSGGRIYVSRDPLYDGWGKSVTYVTNNLITGATITFGLKAVFTNTFRHELGHTVRGLCHHNEPGMMSGIWPADFKLAKLEADNVSVMSKVKEGVEWDKAVGSSSSRSQTYTLEFEECFEKH